MKQEGELFSPKSMRDHFKARGWEGMPGVVYPHEPKKQKVVVPELTENFDRSKYLTSREAADLLHCSESAVRIALHKKKFKHILVRPAGQCQFLLWEKRSVEKFAAERLPITEEQPEKMVDSETAAVMLEVGRSSLYRYAKKGWLHPVRMRLQTEKGLRIHVYYRRDEVKKLKFRINAMHQMLKEMHQQLSGIKDDMSEDGQEVEA